MSKSYTPGLKVLNKTRIIKQRQLPLKGVVHLEKGMKVGPDTIVASTEIPGNVHMVNVANKLNIEAKQIPECMLLKENDKIKKDQILARSKGIFGLFKSEVKSPIDGEIINISVVTGQVVISEKPLAIKLDAYIPGVISKVINEEGVIVNSNGTFIQGIIGVGGESKGELKVLINSHENSINTSDINDSLDGKIIVCGSYINYDIYKKASEVGVKGIVCGGFDYNDMSKILGKPLGVAITGTEESMNLILTEGFGEIEMAKRTFQILKKNDGKLVSINGATQIRAGVLRPEIFIESENSDNNTTFNEDDLIISEGSVVRVIREPFFGKIGKVISLPTELHKMKSETKVRVAKIEFLNRSQEIIPRANLEVILSD